MQINSNSSYSSNSPTRTFVRHEIDTTNDKPGLLGLGEDSQTISSAVRRKKSALISVNSENGNAVVAVDCNSEENTTAEGVHGGKRKGAGRPKVNNYWSKSS